MTRQTTAPLEHLSLNATNRFADFFVRNVQRGTMLLDPPYQRGDVWTDSQRMGLVRSWLMGIPVPAVVINDRSGPAWARANPGYFDGDGTPAVYAVIDGKQRILCAAAWLGGDLLVPASWFPADHVDTAEDTDDGSYVRFTGLTIVGQRFAENRCVLPCAEGRLATVHQEAEVYLLVNGGGTPQTSADMKNAARVAADGN
ncbi:DUF262 domain-containing protein [Micromonospora sp. 15K316]|uniref:DUF262 domain-containing protein n=1 Tax=Micromonospora sp. 15K316 TaxID=2530376 RepID=UPI00104F9D9F|nr:DUF262 domain-containing protein [Micromonospora sp. 15K316]TDC26878.1 DUF262 domain-containing protein [Micromonospora sp. 15K316]